MGSAAGDPATPGRATGQGRHRRVEPAAEDDEPELPRSGGTRTRHGKPEIAPEPVWPDTGPLGLRMFNLGTIPASVTPPRTWRRAAWFTVVASVAALAGLLTLGAVLVGPVRDTGRIDSTPYFPDGTPLAAIGGPALTSRPARPVGSSDGRPATRVSITDVTSSRYVGSRTDQPQNGAGGPRSSAPDRPPDAAPPATEPVITTLTTAGDPVVDPAKLIKRTRTFFAEVTTNAQAAANLTTSAVRDDAVAVIHRKYGDMAAIQIQSISLDPTSGLTICVLRVVNKDGTAETQRITLQFTLTGDPKITNPGG